VAYLPASVMYILSMTLGYVGLRYIELSISSPICNASGALVAITALIIDGPQDMGAPTLIAVALVCIGALLLIGCYVVHIEANFELFLGLGLIVFGAALHVRALKKGEKY
jgi:hypothetical protein